MDDSPPVRAAIKRILEAALGAVVEEAGDGAQGLRAVLATDAQFDCVICDLQMPVLDGIGFLRATRARANRMELPVLLLTSVSDVGRKVEGFKNGASDFVTKPFQDAELIARVQSHVNLAQLHRQLTTMANTDPLTGVANRRRFSEVFVAEFQRAQRLDTDIALLLVDVDHFKSINDDHGHAVGDRALEGLGRILLANHRIYDQVGRMGGEEFAVLLPATPMSAALAVAERLRDATSSTPIAELEAGRVTVSIGVAAGLQGADDSDVLYRRADAQLYKAKRAGRNCVVGE